MQYDVTARLGIESTKGRNDAQIACIICRIRVPKRRRVGSKVETGSGIDAARKIHLQAFMMLQQALQTA